MDHLENEPLELTGEDPKSRESRTFSTGEGRLSVAAIGAAVVSLLLDQVGVMQFDSVDRKLIIAGGFVIAAVLVLSRGFSKQGTGG